MGGSRSGNFGNTKGSRSFLDRLSDILTAASLIPGLDTFADLAAIPVDLLRKDWLSAGLGAIGAIPVIGEVADTAKITRKAEDAFKVVRTLNKQTDSEKITKITKEIAPQIAKISPLRIPKKATVNLEPKNGYNQIKYRWKTGKYKYEVRWHSHRPTEPDYQKNSWIVQRTLPGIGFGKNARPDKKEILIQKKNGKNKWIPFAEWEEAGRARYSGSITKKQQEILDDGHWNHE